MLTLVLSNSFERQCLALAMSDYLPSDASLLKVFLKNSYAYPLGGIFPVQLTHNSDKVIFRKIDQTRLTLGMRVAWLSRGSSRFTSAIGN
jgi:hypothetical protein